MVQSVASEIIAPFDVDGQELVSAEHSVKQAIQSSPNRHVIKAVLYGHPVLKDATTRLARIVSHAFPDADERGLLLQNAIEAASAAYADSTEADERFEQHETTYLVELLRYASRMVRFRAHCVRADESTKRWPMADPPLLDWAKKEKAVRLVFTPDGDKEGERRQAMQLILAGRIMSIERSAAVMELARAQDVA